MVLEVLCCWHAVGEGDSEAFSAGFHQVTHRAWPVPLGSIDLVTRRVAEE